MPVEDFARDVKHMTRGLRKSPGFTLAVILTLGLGIGANGAIFSVVDQLLLRPLPYPNGDELVTVYESLSASRFPSPRSDARATSCPQPTGSIGSETAAR